MGLCNLMLFCLKRRKAGYDFLQHIFGGKSIFQMFSTNIQVLSFLFFVWSYDRRTHINQCIFSMEIGKFEVSYYDGSFFSFFLQSLFVEVVPQVETYSILHKVWIFMEEGPHQLLQICLKRNLSQLLLLLSI